MNLSYQVNWMQTWSGGRFCPDAVDPEDIEPGDIAHALSLLCRYGGHVDRFYSVAEHCVLISEVVAPENALAALLHDATEAYLVDVPRPVKDALPAYRVIEQRVWRAIADRFHLDPKLPADVLDADTRIVLNERDTLMSRATRPWYQDGRFEPLDVRVEGWLPAEAEGRYLRRLSELGGLL